MHILFLKYNDKVQFLDYSVRSWRRKPISKGLVSLNLFDWIRMIHLRIHYKNGFIIFSSCGLCIGRCIRFAACWTQKLLFHRRTNAYNMENSQYFVNETKFLPKFLFFFYYLFCSLVVHVFRWFPIASSFAISYHTLLHTLSLPQTLSSYSYNLSGLELKPKINLTVDRGLDRGSNLTQLKRFFYLNS